MTKIARHFVQQVQRYNKAVAGEDVPDEEEVLAGGKDAAVKAAAKGKLLSHVVKRNVMQVVLCALSAPDSISHIIPSNRTSYHVAPCHRPLTKPHVIFRTWCPPWRRSSMCSNAPGRRCLAHS